MCPMSGARNITQEGTQEKPIEDCVILSEKSVTQEDWQRNNHKRSV